MEKLTIPQCHSIKKKKNPRTPVSFAWEGPLTGLGVAEHRGAAAEGGAAAEVATAAAAAHAAPSHRRHDLDLLAGADCAGENTQSLSEVVSVP